jgi:hypothetical protein
MVKGQIRRELARRAACIGWCIAVCIIVPPVTILEWLFPRKPEAKQTTEG